MMCVRLSARAVLGAAVVLVASALSATSAETASVFRGPGGSAVYDVAGLPTSWDENKNSNIRWKAELPLAGWGTPVVWQDKVLVTGASDEKRVIWCFATADGKSVWKTELPVADGATEGYATDTMEEAWDRRMYAAGTPVTDGKLVYVFFSNGQLAALNLADGKVIWNMALGDTFSNKFGCSNALQLHKGKLIVVFQGEEQFIAGYDAATGKQLWKADRASSSWASPIVIKTAGGKELVVLLGDPDVTAWDPGTGKQVWSIDILGNSPDFCVGPSPIFNGKLVFVNSQNAGIYAVDPDEGKKVWEVDELPEGAGFADGVSMVAHGKYVYQFFDYYLSCLNAATGEVAKEREMDEMASYASPFANGDHLYLITKGDVAVVKADPDSDFADVGKGVLDGSIEASPAVVEGAILIRTDQALYCIGK